MTKDSSMLLIAPLHLRMTVGNGLEIEAQAANGLSKWAQHFSKVTLCALVLPENTRGQYSSSSWISVDSLTTNNPIKCIPLPWSYHPLDHFRDISAVKEKIEPLVRSHQYLQFCIGGCTFGDWSAVAARIAYKGKQDYAVHTDWVAHAHSQASKQSNFYRKIRTAFDYWTMKIAEKRIINRAKLGLFHGAECYEFYKDYCANSYLIHDIHVSDADLPTTETIKEKANNVYGRPLRIVYAGRMHPMKAPDHWMNILFRLKQAGVVVEAKWLGDGVMFEQIKNQVQTLKLDANVELYGFVSDRNMVLNELRHADLLMFCHLTPESPRILIEALNQATPIVGYASDYPSDLIQHGGGLLVEQANEYALFEKIVHLDENRDLLNELILKAGEAGHNLTDEKVFSHRAELIKSVLNK